MKRLTCGHAPSAHSSITTGYGKDSRGRTYCYACCAKRDVARMVETGRATLYLCSVEIPPEGSVPGGFASRDGPALIPSERATLRRWYIKNWPGSLSFPVSFMRTGRHNIAGRRYDAWFTGPDGKHWHAVTYGDMTQIAHCKRIKS